MKASKWFLSGWVVVLVAAGWIWAQEPQRPKASPSQPATKPAEKAKSKLLGHWGMIASVVNLNEEQKEQLAEQVEAMNDAVTAVGRKHNKDLENLYYQHHMARISNRKKETARRWKEIKEFEKQINGERDQVRKEHLAKILATFTPAQRVNYEAFGFFRVAMFFYKKVGLTDEQKVQIKTLCRKAAGEILKVQAAEAATQPTTAEADSAKSRIRKRLVETIRQEVLTAEQRAKLEAPKTQPAAATKPSPATQAVKP